MKQQKSKIIRSISEEQAATEFVKDYFQPLTSPSFSQPLLKSLEREFFVTKHNNRVSRPSNRQIISELLQLMLRRGMSIDAIQGYLNELPVFRLAGDTFHEQLCASLGQERPSSAIAPEEIEMLQKVGAYEATRQSVKSKLEESLRDELQHLEEEIDQKKDEYDALPSILEEQVIEEPQFDPSVEDIKPWWERFYLRANPFPQKDGLSDISHDMYESVLVKTAPFENTLSALRRDGDFLFHTAFLLVGDYGYGKTTFIDYLSYFLVNKNILPLRITCAKPHPDSSGFLNDFYLKLRNLLRRELDTIQSQPRIELADLDVDDQIVELARELTNTRLHGVVVFLDDYHKHRLHFPHIFDFLGLLQILKDRLTREGINVGFVVSGTPAWLQELHQNGQMVGFLDNSPIEMPSITPELLCDVFNQRIRAYCYDKSPRTIKVDFVKRIFEQTEARTGFRDYLNRIITELTHNNLSIINTPIEVPEATLTEIKKELERDPALKSSFSKLNTTPKFHSFTQQQIAKCYELLIQVNIQDGVSEDDKLFQGNTYYFQQLRDSALIQKRKATGTTRTGGFKWVIHNRLQQAANLVSENFGLSLSDYLLKIYGWKSRQSIPEPVDDLSSPELVNLKGFFGDKRLDIPPAAKNNIEQSFKLFDGVLLIRQADKADQETIKRGENAIDRVSAAFFELDSSLPFFMRANIKELEHRWELHWLEDEAVTELFKRLDGVRTQFTPDSYHLALKQIKDVYPALADRLKLIVDDMRHNTSHGLRSHNVRHTREEISIFDQVLKDQYALRGESHFNYVKRITDYLEVRMRAFLYATTTLLFGDDYIKHFPEEVRKYAQQNLSSRQSYAPFYNAYDGFTRPQFRSTFRTGSKIKDGVADALRIEWQTSDWDNFFDLFVEENIATSHQQLSSYDFQDRSRYISYCRQMQTFTGGLNLLVRTLFEDKAYLVMPSQEASVEDVIFKYQFKKAKDNKEGRYIYFGAIPPFLQKAQTVEHALTTKVYKGIQATVLQKIRNSPLRCITEDLLEIEYLFNNYGVSWQELIHSLSYAKQIDKSIQITPWLGSSVLISESNARG